MKKILTIVVLLVVLSAATSSLAVAATGEQQGPVIHYVAPGETLYGIAARYRVPVGAIMQANGLRNPDLIYAGQPLRIPVGEGIYPPGMAPVPGGCTYHTVRAGDTLSAIAMLYGVSVRELMVSNRIYNPDMVYVGQRICVPGRPGY
ncbi:MAG: LysM peptidoglycan-binding domain-containing protein, partial [Chloroflexi bacterium]